jgi:hypothetical protein
MVTLVPIGPLVGVNDEIVGGVAGLTFVVSVSVLLALFGSPCVALTVAVVVSWPTERGVTTIVAVRLLPELTTDQLQVTVPAASAQVPPPLALAEP